MPKAVNEQPASRISCTHPDFTDAGKNNTSTDQVRPRARSAQPTGGRSQLGGLRNPQEVVLENSGLRRQDSIGKMVGALPNVENAHLITPSHLHAIKNAFVRLQELDLFKPPNRIDVRRATPDRRVADAEAEYNEAYRQVIKQEFVARLQLLMATKEDLRSNPESLSSQDVASLCAQTVADCYKQQRWVTARCGEFAALLFQFCVEAGLPPENLLMVETKDKHVRADHTFVLYSSSKFDLHGRGQEVVLPQDGKVWALDGWAKDKLEFLENRKTLTEYCVKTMKQVTLRASSPKYVRACGV